MTVKPPINPMATAAAVMATANSQPTAAAAIGTEGGSINGDHSQNAITVELGVKDRCGFRTKPIGLPGNFRAS